MAKAELFNPEPVITLSLTLEEAKLIKGLTQNYLSAGWEPPAEMAARESIFMSLKNAGV